LGNFIGSLSHYFRHFLSTRKFNVSELNFKRPIVTTQWHCLQTSVYALTAISRGGKINIELHIDWSTAKTTAPQITLCLTKPRRKKHSVLLSSFNDTQFSIIFDVMFCTHCQCLNVPRLIHVTSIFTFYR
jgi:hypothetical protein